MTRKNDLRSALDTGEQLASEILKRRKPATARRKAAIKSADVSAYAKEASASIRSGISIGTLIAEGDSWFDYPFNDILKGLEDDFGYDVESVAKAGDRVEDMAYSGSQLNDLVRRIEKVIRRGDTPKAILLSGGGNDIAGEIELGMLLNHANSNIAGLNNKVIDGVINERLHYAYVSILSAITKVCTDMLGSPVPIVLHGYDYPVPDGRGFAGGFWFLPGPWLEPGFRLKGYMAMPQRLTLMQEIIDRFNAMLQSVAKSREFPHVHYLNLRTTLQPNEKWWANELHPTKKGFAAVTALFAAKIAPL
ncbi:SGNH/GDSL hydrolase family protein [Xanthomonas sp. 1678]|uniref:SGNH/GDSL hydrolase family protein n=1 Tax=Xanthomonas sp. 1678 TaxID=3158788 RepID=UPI00286432D1|nr:lysophospholipase L1-like esterase [Xanthomonas translucens]